MLKQNLTISLLLSLILSMGSAFCMQEQDIDTPAESSTLEMLSQTTENESQIQETPIVPTVDHRGDFGCIRWGDAFLCLEKRYYRAFLAKQSLEEEPTVHIIWNDRYSICRLTPFHEMVKSGYSGEAAKLYFISRNNNPNILKELADRIFPNLASSYRIVGALDSHLPSTMYLQNSLVSHHNLHINVSQTIPESDKNPDRLNYGWGSARIAND